MRLSENTGPPPRGTPYISAISIQRAFSCNLSRGSISMIWSTTAITFGKKVFFGAVTSLASYISREGTQHQPWMRNRPDTGFKPAVVRRADKCSNKSKHRTNRHCIPHADQAANPHADQAANVKYPRLPWCDAPCQCTHGKDKFSGWVGGPVCSCKNEKPTAQCKGSNLQFKAYGQDR